ncbi:hypothetical protein BDW62DRAFT_201424 [Aspergillus aurantiobrunneus]
MHLVGPDRYEPSPTVAHMAHTESTRVVSFDAVVASRSPGVFLYPPPELPSASTNRQTLLRRPQNLTMLITRGISLVNFAVASSALAFQVFVLYPWHNQLDDEFKALKHEHRRVLRQLDRVVGSAEKSSASP